jgi:excisionase family DNA binding protein
VKDEHRDSCGASVIAVNPRLGASAAPSFMVELIDIDELSRRLHIAKGTLYNWVHLRRIPFIKAGRCLRFDFEKVFEALSHCPKMEEAAKR